MKRTVLVGLTPLVALVAACGLGHSPKPSTQQVVATSGSQPQQASSQPGPDRCTTAHLSIRLGTAGHAAGSTYQPLVFTNTGSSSCTLTGYPGVSYVAGAGKQVGAAASRNSQHAAKTVTLGPGGHASAMVQFVAYRNFPVDRCRAVTVTGLRVYPPGKKSASYVPFANRRSACSSSVVQLTVQAVVAGASGM
jgi:hypothetical protein